MNSGRRKHRFPLALIRCYQTLLLGVWRTLTWRCLGRLDLAGTSPRQDNVFLGKSITRLAGHWVVAIVSVSLRICLTRDGHPDIRLSCLIRRLEIIRTATRQRYSSGGYRSEERRVGKEGE